MKPTPRSKRTDAASAGLKKSRMMSPLEVSNIGGNGMSESLVMLLPLQPFEEFEE
jgi:hypothetical protein